MEDNHSYFANSGDELYELYMYPRIIEMITTIRETQQVRSTGEGTSQVLATVPRVPRAYLRRPKGMPHIVTNYSSLPLSEQD